MASEQNLAALKKQRATTKGSCTRTSTYVGSITAVTPSVSAQLKERKIKLDQYWSEYNAVQTQIQIVDESETTDRSAFEDSYYALAARITEILHHHDLPSRDAATPSPGVSGVSNRSESRINVRLPKLDLPKFSGKYDEWFPFFDAFNSIIHSSDSLSNVQKLQYLRGCLSSEASDVINSLEISDLNYNVAWRLLKERYDNKRVIVHTHVKAIMELPSMTKENAVELRQIANGATKHIHALQALRRPVAYWDDLLIYVLVSKLDSLTSREWQISLTGSDLPTLKQLLDFIAHRCQVLEATGKSSISTRSKSNAKHQAACHAVLKFKCSYCNGDHSIYRCKDFLALPIARRISEIRTRKLCANCLRSTTHVANKCTSGSCKTCKAKHNTLLHAKTETESCDGNNNGENKTAATTTPSSAVVTHSSSTSDKQVMLSTAVVYVDDHEGLPRECPVLLDCGSQANFVSRKFLNLLAIKPRSSDISISGINGTVTQSSQNAHLKLYSRFNSYSANIICIVADQVTNKLSAFNLKRDTFDLPRNLKLADPQFHKSLEVDVLIGAELFWDILCVGQIKASAKHPIMQKTRLGWILAGRLGGISKSVQRVQAFHANVSNAQLHEQLGLFWKQENVMNESNNLTFDEAHCEQHFLDNVSRTPQGRFVVGLPFKEHVINKLGDSREIALKRFLNLERHFKRNPVLKDQYSRFMSEYQSLGHMRKVDVPPYEESLSFYLPHHSVYKASDQASKIRVVFDASYKSSSGLSLNDALMIGPVVQQDLTSILMRFRTFAYVFVADIIKMYRQILVDSAQTKFQRILWRTDTESNVDTYELNTVTYGTAPASYLATRCLKYLAEIYAARFPVGSKHVQRDFYVDDLLTGADKIEDVKLVRDEVIQLLRLGSFELSKWASNLPALLEEIDDQCGGPVDINNNANPRILGIRWDQACDVFCYSYQAQENSKIVSKRTVLSEVSRLFDPLGLLGPVIVTAKLLLQELWQSGCQWDESVPQHIHTRWSGFRSELANLNQLRIPRRVKFATDSQSVQIYGFCDASQHAYGACIYVRTKINEDEFRIELLCSKSRVAPLKAVTLPRWAVFVSNRVGEIQRLTKPECWRHIASADNPADVLSRGLNSSQILDSHLWWEGPEFLRSDETHWPKNEFQILGDDTPERRAVLVAVTTSEPSIVSDLLARHSNLDKMCRILSYVFRFGRRHQPSGPTVFVSPGEIATALNFMCRAIQRNAFPEEYRALIKALPLAHQADCSL
ncbi:uncharacterized protein [Temnothorax nylanderi]|uniref:uncharacterized protein n=1 Tax=Temnothorax nylanderi TaxID=102681 RepID=UPI003A8C304B